MASPIVQTRFGSRPLLEVPAMEVAGASDIAVTSIMVPGVQAAPTVPAAPPNARAVLAIPVAVPAAPAPAMQAPAVPTVPAPALVAPNIAPLNPFQGASNPMVGSGLYNLQPTSLSTGGLPISHQPYLSYGGRHHSAPQGPLYNDQGRPYYYGPNGEVIFPPPVYPGVANPFAGAVPNSYSHPQGYNPYGGPPGRMMYPGIEPRPFVVTCELEYGRITNIDLRESPGTFRGIPDFIRLELLRTYGSEPHTEVRIKFADGEFHIYASHEKWHKKKRSKSRDSRAETESLSDGDYGETDVDSYTHIKPRHRGERPRRIVHEKGWNRFR
ncbi:rad52 motif-containing protein 1 [Plakobranchus ocellatus]|uniref:Rad52 motif-containing protein 1 n=1 Tax=Plakobranchus ocellatus TaxID=259542 RepID=A0AAV4C386_9GAST|nr:rad52 motif-containing protein 1 [Plakobranchus ocellatus]